MKRIFKVLCCLLIWLCVLPVCAGYGVTLLWNSILSGVLGCGVIGLWQGVGLFSSGSSFPAVSFWVFSYSDGGCMGHGITTIITATGIK